MPRKDGEAMSESRADKIRDLMKSTDFMQDAVRAALTEGMEPVAWKFVSPLGTVRKFQDRSPVLADPEAHFWTALYTADQLAAAVLAERERCAKVCDIAYIKDQDCEVAAAAIRGQKP
jgi:hypothetical protein